MTTNLFKMKMSSTPPFLAHCEGGGGERDGGGGAGECDGGGGGREGG